MNYIERLKAFNASEKYQEEVSFMLEKINPKQHEVIIDYGCGLGRMVEAIYDMGVDRVHGFDIVCHLKERPIWYRDVLYFECDKIYFMHSLAHINEPFKVLVQLREKILKPTGEIHVLTPNQSWIDLLNNPDYVPDPTVINHFTAMTLEKLFLDSGYKNVRIEQQGNQIGNERERLYAEARP